MSSKRVEADRNFNHLAAEGVLKSDDDLNICYKKQKGKTPKEGEGHKLRSNMKKKTTNQTKTNKIFFHSFFYLKVMLKAKQAPLV